MNIPKIEFIAYIYILIKNIYNTDSQWNKQEARFACATQVELVVNHKTNITSGEWVWCSKHIARASELGSYQSNLCNSWGYERLQKYKDSLKDCFENVHIKQNTNILTAQGRSQFTDKHLHYRFYRYSDTLP